MKAIATRKPVINSRPEPKFLPPRLVINAVEGWGKTTLGSQAPKPLLLMARGETGYQTLYGSGLVPAVPTALIEDWLGLLELLHELAQGCEYKTIVFDALNGFERLCHEYVCARDYNNDWSDKGFYSYMRGPDTAVTDWVGLLSMLDRVRAQGVMIILLGHVIIKPFKNPAGPDYDRYVCDINPKTWGVTHKWSDAVFFGNFLTIVDEDAARRRRGIGGDQRVAYAERCDAWDAKNRYGINGRIDFPDDPTQNWATIWQHITPRKEKNNGNS
ncbi:MAG TPA: ATP-binding protein [bacterium]|nr:ATP-binding protein [bacterium]